MRIRPPEEYNDVGVSNQFRPATIDVEAATAPVREIRRGLKEVSQIVDLAHDNAMRSQALADSIQLETRLTALRAEMDNEPPPDGVDVTDWAQSMPQRWSQRATAVRDEVMRSRGRRPNSYLRYFEERSGLIMGREEQASIERAQAAIIDIDRGAGNEVLSALAAQAMDPDLPETADGDAPSRARYEQQYIETAREFARRGTWSHSYAAERITQLQSERRQFMETEGRFQEARRSADAIRAQFPDDLDQQIARANEIENARARETTLDFLMADSARDRQAFEAENQAARSRVETLINQHGAAWERYATQADVERINRDPGSRAQIRSQLDALNDPTGSTAQTRSLNSARYRALLEDVGNSSDPLVGRVFMGINLNEPISAEEANALREAGFIDAQPGSVLSATLTREDYNAIVELQRQRVSGQTASGGMIVDREVNDIVAYATANGLADFGSDDDAGNRRIMQQQFRAFVSQIVRDNFSNGGARDLTAQEIADISRLALSRTNASGRANSAAPMYRRRSGNLIPYDQIPAATAMRIRRRILATGEGAGLSAAQVDNLVANAYAEENRVRARNQ